MSQMPEKMRHHQKKKKESRVSFHYLILPNPNCCCHVQSHHLKLIIKINSMHAAQS